MLDTVSELSEDLLWNIRRTLCHEIHSHTLASDKTYDLLDLVYKSLGSLVKEHMGLIEEEHKLRKVHIADFRKLSVELCKEPEKECRIKLRLKHELVSCQHIHNTLALLALEKVVDIK